MPEFDPHTQSTNFLLAKHSGAIHNLETRARETDAAIRANAEVTVRLTAIVELQNKSHNLLKKRHLGLKFLLYGYIGADIAIWSIRAISELW